MYEISIIQNEPKHIIFYIKRKLY